MQRLWPLGVTTALLWSLAAGGAVYWGLRMAGTSAVAVPDSAPVVASGDAALRQSSIARLLGAQAAAAAGPGPAPATRFSLAGVIASPLGDGAALISVDGKPARPFAVGSEIAPGYTLKSLGSREALLSEGMDAPVKMTLSLPVPQGGAGSALSPLGIAPLPQPAAAPPAAVSAVPVSPPPVTAASAAGVPVPASPTSPPASSEGPAGSRPNGPSAQVRSGP